MIYQPYNYPYCDFKFTDWNPVQLKCYPFFTEDCNLVVSASTASGKTVIAEAIMGYELSKTETSKVVYVSPLKAIGNEKFNDWSKHETFKKFNKVLVSSETNVTQNDFESSRMIISTVESMNLRCRARDKWLKDVKVLIFDEAHLINDDSRGAGSEAMIMALTKLNPDCRIICLSGTMSNYIEIAKWLKACNNKSTKYVNSSWRPSELIKRIEIIEDFKEQQNIILNISKEIHQEDKKMLIFVHSKQVGENVCKHLKEYGISCAFYHAGLKSNIKEKMLVDFKSNYSSLNILVCTSSLSMGVTL
jgi:replicative superfamily II helicase